MKRHCFFSLFWSFVLMFTFLSIMAWTNVMASTGLSQEVPVIMTGFTLQEIPSIEHVGILFTYAMGDTYFIYDETSKLIILKAPGSKLPVNSQEVLVVMTGFYIQDNTVADPANLIKNEKPILDKVINILAITLPINSQEVGYRIGIGKLVSGHMA